MDQYLKKYIELLNLIKKLGIEINTDLRKNGKS